MDFLFCFSNAFDVRIIIDVCVAPLNYLTNEGNGAIEMQHNNNIVYQSWPILLWTVSFVIRMFTSFRCFKSMPLLNRSKYIYIPLLLKALSNRVPPQVSLFHPLSSSSSHLS